MFIALVLFAFLFFMVIGFGMLIWIIVGASMGGRRRQGGGPQPPSSGS